jgi:hypothetical protein
MTPQEFEKRIDALVRVLNRDKSDVILEPMKNLEKDMKERIFEKGLNSKGSKIGKYGSYYSSEYKSLWIPLRQKRGLQTKFVDLKFTGDLMNSFVAEKDEKDSVAIGFDDDENYEKSLIQEILQGQKKGGRSMDIFTPRRLELNKLQKDAVKTIEDELDKLFSKL